MKHTTHNKRPACIALSALMLCTVTASFPAVTASAEPVPPSGIADFDNGVLKPWQFIVSPGFNAEAAIEDGVLKVSLKNNNSGDLSDCQLIHKKLRFQKAHTYRVHAEVTSTKDGNLYAAISDTVQQKDIWHNAQGATSDAVGYTDNGEDYSILKMKAGETLVIDAKFKPDAAVQDAEFCFSLGKSSFLDTFPDLTELSFDNLSIFDETLGTYVTLGSADCHYSNLLDPISTQYPVAVNQLGYLPDAPKVAVAHMKNMSKSWGYTNFLVVNAETGKAVFEGNMKTSSGGTANMLDADSGEYTFTLDFSSVKEPGYYYIQLLNWEGVPLNSPSSLKFCIGEDVYAGLTANAFNYFYLNRSGMPVSAEYIMSGGNNQNKTALAHDEFAHDPDTAYLQSNWIWNPLDKVDTSGEELTASGGWYDSRSYNKFAVDGASALWMLQNMYEMILCNDPTCEKAAALEDALTDSEEGSYVPTVLREARTEIEMLRGMIIRKDKVIKNDEGAAIHTKNMVSHAIRYNKSLKLAVKPWALDEYESADAPLVRIADPPTTAATMDTAAVLAQASRLFRQIDPSYAEILLADAKDCYAAAKANPDLYAPYPGMIGSGIVQDGELHDEAYWAACELYITSGDAAYLADMAQNPNAFALSAKTERDSVTRYWSFDQYNTAAYGTLSLALHSDQLTKKAGEALLKNIQNAADAFLQYETANGFAIPYLQPNAEEPSEKDAEGYETNSNGYILSNSLILAYAEMLTGNEDYRSGAISGLDYIFGKNALNISYVTGCGTYTAANPTHIYWAKELDQDFPSAPDGVLVSGPTTALNDQFVSDIGMNQQEIPSQKCYVDAIEAWSVNSASLLLNAPLTWMMSYLEFMSAEPANTVVGSGDVNLDGSVTVADAVALQQFLISDLVLSQKSGMEADVSGDRKLNAIDLTLLKQQILTAKKHK